MTSYYREYTGRRHSRLPGSLFLLFTVVFTYWGVSQLITSNTGEIISPIPETVQPPTSIFSFLEQKKTPDTLRKEIEKVIDDKWKNYSVYVKDYTSNFSMGINETVIYTAASVNKVPILAALYYQAQKGKVDFDESITIQPEDIQGGTGSIQYDPPYTSYTVRTLAMLMMQKSDNTAANVLANKYVGRSTIQDLVDSWGMIQTNITNNKTSNRDMAVLFEKIFNRNVANEALTQEMLAFLKDSDFEERIPGALPPGVTVYHKIGNEIGNIHDVGIVVEGTKAYYIGLLTEDIRDEEETKQMEAKISKLVYEYLK
jgi:beta-lactamase class A